MKIFELFELFELFESSTNKWDSYINRFQNKWGYTMLQYAMIKAWGGVLYLDYDTLPSGKGDLARISQDLDEYLTAIKKNDSETVQDFEEWFQDGAKAGGKVHLTKQAFDDVLHSAEKQLDKELIVYKTGNGNKPKNRWISTSTRKGAYKDFGNNETEYILPIGTRVIFADGIADDDEIIINTSELP